jgi:ribonuclease-3
LSGSRSRSEASGLERRLGHRFADPALLELALTHRSHAHESEPFSGSYERLEYLGDALLGLVVSEWLYRQDPEASEGVLSRRRQAIVRTATLAHAARQLGLGETIRLGRGEERTGGRDRVALLADVFEAVLGAVYLDGGIRAARAFVKRHLGPALRAAGGSGPAAGDYKTLLQETVQARLRRTPRYRIVSTTGPDHALEFEVEVLLGDEVLGRGSGANRQRAEQEAARVALDRIETREE